jgi:hypothetical protein
VYADPGQKGDLDSMTKLLEQDCSCRGESGRDWATGLFEGSDATE